MRVVMDDSTRNLFQDVDGLADEICKKLSHLERSFGATDNPVLAWCRFVFYPDRILKNVEILGSHGLFLLRKDNEAGVIRATGVIVKADEDNESFNTARAAMDKALRLCGIHASNPIGSPGPIKIELSLRALQEREVMF